MSVPEEAGRTARSLITSMKEQPLALGLLVTNLLFVVFLWYYTREINENRHQYVLETQAILKSCIHVDDLEKIFQLRQRQQ